MPYSSGGGRGFGGGGSGFRGSGSGGFRGGSGGGADFSGGRVQYRNFTNAKRYMYYSKNKPQYVYADYDITKTKLIGEPWLLLIYIPFLIFSVIATLYFGINVPKKLDTNYDTKIIIEDQQGVLNNTDDLYNVLQEFYNETGITPAIYTIDEKALLKDGEVFSLEKYAYSLYLEKFSDESHWLLVYMIGDENENGVFVWEWHGMQGNDTGSILTENVTSSFNNKMNNQLSGVKREEIGTVIKNVFAETNSNINGIHIQMPQFLLCIFVFGVLDLLGFLFLGINTDALKYRNAKLVEEEE